MRTTKEEEQARLEAIEQAARTAHRQLAELAARGALPKDVAEITSQLGTALATPKVRRRSAPRFIQKAEGPGE